MKNCKLWRNGKYGLAKAPPPGFRYPSSCTSRRRGLASEFRNGEISLRGRVFISAFLVVALLPIYSLGAVCELNCRTTAISKSTAMGSMMEESASKSTMAGHSRHQSKGFRSSSHQRVSIATPASQDAKAGQTCCPSNSTVSSASCNTQNQSVFQEPTTAPKVGGNPAIVKMFASDHSLLVRNPNRIDTPRTPVRDDTPAPLTLRI